VNVAELKKLLNDIPDNAIVFLDDTYVEVSGIDLVRKEIFMHDFCDILTPEAHIFGKYKITKEEED